MQVLKIRLEGQEALLNTKEIAKLDKTEMRNSYIKNNKKNDQEADNK